MKRHYDTLEIGHISLGPLDLCRCKCGVLYPQYDIYCVWKQIDLKTDTAEAEILTGQTDRFVAAKMLHEWGAKEVVITNSAEVLAYDGSEIYTLNVDGYLPSL